ncbi:MAG: ABC transporter permease [Ktedonobacterales bacterium]|nr:ABC transporter permease [Ktedonobacterales bacterium]
MMNETKQILQDSDASTLAPLPPSATTPRRGGLGSISWDVVWERYGIATILVLLWVVAYFNVNYFGNVDNFAEVLRQSSFVGIAAVGMTYVILMGAFDLSVVSTLGLCAWLAVTLASKHQLGLALTLPLLVGIGIGMLNGTMVAYLRIPAFIVTLAMQFLIRGYTFIVAGGDNALYAGKEYTSLGTGFIAGVPTPFIIFIIVAVVGAVVLRNTPFGRYIYAAGSNAQAAQVAGVPVKRTLFWGFVVVGGCTALAAVLLGARLYTAGPGLEPGFELNVIAAVVLGGTRLSGGRGSLIGTFAAAILFTTLSNVLNLLSIDPFVQQVVTGSVLLIALSVEGVRSRLAERLNRG